MPVVPPAVTASEMSSCAGFSTPVADHASCEATIGELRTMLVDLEERYDDLVLRRWIISQKYEHALGRMRSHDPPGIVWWSSDSPIGRAPSISQPSNASC